jgi:hypothetical protein
MSTITLNIPVIEKVLPEIKRNPTLILDNITAEDRQLLQEVVFDSLSDKDGAPQIGDINISSFTFDNIEKKGRFRISFNIDRQFCCSDTTSCQSDYIDFDFSYASGNISATGHFINWDIDN